MRCVVFKETAERAAQSILARLAADRIEGPAPYNDDVMHCIAH
ncbi:hypothetical protein [Paenibacillus kribbensis]|nr:hypothetical protein [Paenibacillus kribbensis]